MCYNQAAEEDKMSEFKTFLASYGIDGHQFGFEIQATSFEDAQRRLDAIKAWGRIDGELQFIVPASGLFGRFLGWLLQPNIKS